MTGGSLFHQNPTAMFTVFLTTSIIGLVVFLLYIAYASTSSPARVFSKPPKPVHAELEGNMLTVLMDDGLEYKFHSREGVIFYHLPSMERVSYVDVVGVATLEQLHRYCMYHNKPWEADERV